MDSARCYSTTRPPTRLHRRARAGPVPVPDASRPASSVVVPGTSAAPPDPASSSIPNNPSDAVAFDVRLDVQIPDTTLGAASREGLTEEFRLGKTLVWCKSFLVHDAAETIPSDSPDRVSGVGDVPVDALNVVAVEPAPGSPNVHLMITTCATTTARAWRKHARMFSDVDDAEFGAGPTIGREPLDASRRPGTPRARAAAPRGRSSPGRTASSSRTAPG